MAFASGAPSNLFATDAAKPKRLGRRNGSRSKLATKFFEDFYEAWEEQGYSALMRAAFHDPVAFVSIAARLMPQKIEVTHPTDGMTDERLAEMLELAERMAGLKAEAAKVVQGQVVDAPPSLPAITSHAATFENGAALDLAREGGGEGKARGTFAAGNTQSTCRDAGAADTRQRHNGLEASSSAMPMRPCRSCGVELTPAEIDLCSRCGAPAAPLEEDIDPESLF